ncbi:MULTISPECIES: HlyD family type I secretion periplasmic adaptor subunit [unclassified Aureimonas]|uniref:HlyD family type I secretion periplasmic adaptor subunit n=1 Tax=unclassified Aureimonas TaxID=2615206 RepID=UPI000B1F7FCC|nr:MULTISPECIES: HlyD family type I secretion periplasmic adaptor subunit [unclassified Aureimonas]
MTLLKPVWAKDVDIDTKTLTFGGLTLAGTFALVFGVWAVYAPLAAAAVAPGYIAASGRNQRVQHLEGGIVSKILVREGDRVTTGQVLFELDATKALAARNRLQFQILTFNAQLRRLTAEREGQTQIEFSPDIKAAAAASISPGILDEQEKEFTVRLKRYDQESKILRQRVVALNDQISGLEAQQTAVETQVAVVQDEAKRKLALLKKGLTDRSEYTQLVRAEADLVGQLGQVRSSILSSRTQIVEAEVQFSRLTTQRVETAATELNKIRAALSDAEEQLAEAESILDRVLIRAPSDGIVVSMGVNTPGSVVRAGDALLELLPTSNALEVEARISPSDVDVVHVGQDATMRFSALNSRTTPVVDGTVSYVSADRLVDTESKQAYYNARIKIAEALPAGVKTSDIYPGMPVETYIKIGDRTFFEYLLKPLEDSFSRAFRQE